MAATSFERRASAVTDVQRHAADVVPPVDMAGDNVLRTRRGFIGAALAALASAMVIAMLWLIARGAPSAGRDPALATTPSP